MQIIIATIVVSTIAAGLFSFGAVCYTGIIPEKTRENRIVTWARKSAGQALLVSVGLLATGITLGAISSGAW